MPYAATEPFWNAQLQNAVVVPDADLWPERYAVLSGRAARYGAPERIATGDHPDQAVWRTATGRPDHALIFIHGGYWRRFSAADFAFVAATAAAADATFWNVDYRLMPAVRLADVVADTLAACERACAGAGRVVIAGHSAGAHLALETALRLSRPPAAVLAISGLYDLAPLRHAFIQHDLAFTAEEVAAFSPQTRTSAVPCPVHLAVGAEEKVEFHRQSAMLHDAIRDAGGEASLTFVEGRDHFSVVADLAEEGSGLSALVEASAT